MAAVPIGYPWPQPPVDDPQGLHRVDRVRQTTHHRLVTSDLAQGVQGTQGTPGGIVFVILRILLHSFTQHHLRQVLHHVFQGGVQDRGTLQVLVDDLGKLGHCGIVIVMLVGMINIFIIARQPPYTLPGCVVVDKQI